MQEDREPIIKHRVRPCGCVWTLESVWKESLRDYDVIKDQTELCTEHYRKALEEKLRTANINLKEFEAKIVEWTGIKEDLEQKAILFIYTTKIKTETCIYEYM